MSWVNTYVDSYYNWLREKTYTQEDSSTGWSLINTPFLGAFNDYIEIYAQQSGGKIILSDNGETLSNLELQGLHIQGSKKRKSILEAILLSYGIQNKGDELVIESSINKFPQAKHNILSAIIEINDLYMLSAPNVVSVFKEDVKNYMDDEGLIYTADFISKGTTGLEFNFDFQIAQKDSETVIRSFNTINNSYLSSFLFAWDDIRPVREKQTKKAVKAVAIINDIGREVKPEYLDAIESKNANYLLWSKRDELGIKKMVA